MNQLDTLIITMLDDLNEAEYHKHCAKGEHGTVFVAHCVRNTNMVNLIQWKNVPLELLDTLYEMYEDVYKAHRSFSIRLSDVSRETCVVPAEIQYSHIEQYISVVLADEYWRNLHLERNRAV